MLQPVEKQVLQCEGLIGGKLYYCGDGFYYAQTNARKGGLIYLKCKNSGCKARAKLITNGEVQVLHSFNEHSGRCKPDFLFMETIALRKKILDRCSSERTSLTSIFREECSRVLPEVAATITLSQLKSAMKRARRGKRSAQRSQDTHETCEQPSVERFLDSDELESSERVPDQDEAECFTANPLEEKLTLADGVQVKETLNIDVKELKRKLLLHLPPCTSKHFVMPVYFQSHWKLDFPWVKEGRYEGIAECVWCKSSFSYYKSGRTALQSHASGKKHRGNIMSTFREKFMMEVGESEGGESGPSTSSVLEKMPLEDMEFIKLEEQMNQTASIDLPPEDQEAERSEEIEVAINSITPSPSTHTLDCTSVMSGVKVKPFDTLQARITYKGPKHKKVRGNNQSKKNVENDQNSVNISVNTLMSAIQRLEKVSNKLASTVLEDSYEHFGRYISSILRGLPVKQVNVLKKKIMSDVMDILAQERPPAKMYPPKSVPQKTVADANSRVVSEQGTPTVLQTSEHPQVLLYPGASVGDAPTKNTPLSTETAPVSVDESLIATMTPNSILSTLSESNQSPSRSPRGRKRKKRRNKVESSQSDDHSDSSSKDEFSHDDLALTSRMESSDQNFEIDIEEGRELITIKQDQDLFETVLCGENSNLYIKEEAPDLCDSGQELYDPPSSPSSSTYTCHVCLARFYNKEELSIHLTASHPVIRTKVRPAVIAHPQNHTVHKAVKNEELDVRGCRKRKSCKQCYRSEKRRKKTLFTCSECPDKPGLCLGNCFLTYHQNMN